MDWISCDVLQRRLGYVAYITGPQPDACDFRKRVSITPEVVDGLGVDFVKRNVAGLMSCYAEGFVTRQD